MNNIKDLNKSISKEDNNEYKSYNVYNITQDNEEYKVDIKINNDNIFFKILNYELNLNKENFIRLINIQFKTIEEIYHFINNKFANRQIDIKKSTDYTLIKIMINFNEEKTQNIELNLINNKINKDFIINDICNKFNNKCDALEKEIYKLKEEIKNEKKIEDNNNKNYNENIKNFSDFGLKMQLTKNSYCYNNINNSFTLFNSFNNNNTYLIYSTDIKSIISYNLDEQKINIEIKNAHRNYITNFRHCLIKSTKKNIIMSVSDIDNHIKLWDANIWECILILNNINNQGFLNSACFLNDNDNIYIISSNWNFNNCENLKVFNIKGENIKNINDSDDRVVYIKSFYDFKKAKYYLITGNDRYIKSYDFYENKFYRKYTQRNGNSYYSVIIKYFNNILKIIGSCYDGYIRIWEFHSGDILNTIDTGNKGLIGICLWNDNYLFGGTKENLLKLINLEKNKVEKIIYDSTGNLCTIKKINHITFGECLISQGLLNEQIKIWGFK